MKIGITCHHTYGGSGTVATELGMALADRGHQVHFITFERPYRLRTDPNIYFHQVDVMHYPLFEHTPITLSLAAKMGEVLCTEALDLLHVHYAIPHATAAYLGRQLCDRKNVRIVTTLHGTDITLVGQDPSYFSITRFSIEQSDAVTTVSQWLKDETIREFQITRPIDVISNSVDTNRFHRMELDPTFRSKYAPNNEPIVVHISNFRPVKRVEDVIRIFARIREKMPAKLLMIGDGPMRMPAQQLATKLGVMNDTWFLGKQDEIEKYLSIADLFVFPSQSESFGLAALEAMACGVPVVASRSGGLPEVIVNGQTGYLAEIGDIEHMAGHGIELLGDRPLAQRISEASVQRVHEHFTHDTIVSRYVELYEREIELAASMV
ncbi:MAG TPA: N-acetyl-alpha-D-glucosaminyl L-malate synthase BshA [Firmicutes bacterium]|nr:N-acetyl-alpha-D-glucosaminyl L-malate synthase BshA [Bacillota bacterium]